MILMRTSLAQALILGVAVGLIATSLAGNPANAATQTFHLYGTATGGWGEDPGQITSPGPTLTAAEGDDVTVLAHAQDSFTHNWYLDLNRNAQWDSGEPGTADISGSTLQSVTFVAPAPGTYTYYCEYHQTTMRGSFVVGGESPPPADNTLLYAGIGVGAAVVAIAGILVVRGRKRT